LSGKASVPNILFGLLFCDELEHDAMAQVWRLGG